MNEIALKGVLRKPRSLRESALTKAQHATKIHAGLYQKFSTNVVPSPRYPMKDKSVKCKVQNENSKCKVDSFRLSIMVLSF